MMLSWSTTAEEVHECGVFVSYHECDTRMRYYICHHQTPLRRRERDLVLPNTFAISTLHEEASLLIKRLPEVSP